MNRNKSLLQFSFATMLALLLPGCFIPGDRGAKLGDAMKASAQGNHHDIGGGSNPGPLVGSDVVVEGSAGAASTVSDKNQDSNFELLTDVSYERSLNGPINSITHFTLTPGVYEGQHDFVGLYLGGGIVDLKSDSLANQAIQDAWTLDGGVTVRHYFSPPWTVLCPYVGCSIGGILLRWDYRKPVVAGGETIEVDSLEGVEGSASLGLSTQRDCRLSAFAEVGVGGILFYDTTIQGFENDVFDNYGYVFAKAGICLKF